MDEVGLRQGQADKLLLLVGEKGEVVVPSNPTSAGHGDDWSVRDLTDARRKALEVETARLVLVEGRRWIRGS